MTNEKPNCLALVICHSSFVTRHSSLFIRRSSLSLGSIECQVKAAFRWVPRIALAASLGYVMEPVLRIRRDRAIETIFRYPAAWRTDGRMTRSRRVPVTETIE